jgi:putative hydrolase of HD superfamily
LEKVMIEQFFAGSAVNPGQRSADVADNPTASAATTDAERLRQQLAFIVEIDKLKGILRRTQPIGEERRENSAEHSWQLALMALLLAEHANEPLDVLHVMRMVLVHDIVEIDAGDTYCYDVDSQVDQAERETRAANRIFGMLPAEQAADLGTLWEEFEARQTPEAKFANALDRLMPLLHNLYNDGGSWVEHDIARSQVMQRCRPICAGSETLWRVAQSVIDLGVEKGYLRP